MAFQVLGHILVGLVIVVGGAVGLAFEESLVSLAPVVLVFAVVVVSGLRYADFKKVGITEHGICRSVASAGMAIDSGMVEIDPGIALGQLGHACNLVGKRVIAHIAVVNIVIFLGTPGISHTVDLDDNETQLRQRLRVAARRGKRPASNASLLRPRIDVVDDRILLVGIKVRRTKHQPIEIGYAVAALHAEGDGRLPSGGQQSTDVGFLDGRNVLAFQVPKHSDRWNIGLGVVVHNVAARRRKGGFVIAVLGGKQSELLAVEANAIEMIEVGIAAFFAAHAHKVEQPVLFVDPQ